jgi:integrase
MSTGRRIGLRDIRALKPGQVVWDNAVIGFGARRSTRTIAYHLKFRTVAGRQRWLTIGKHGSPWTPDTARNEARRLLGEIAKGADPAAEKHAARTAVTVAELCRRYLDDAESGRLLVRGGKPKRESTLRSDRIRIARHIVPLMGHLPIAAVTRADAEKMMHDIANVTRSRGGRGVARRTVALFGAICSFAIECGLIAANPVTRLRKFAEGRRERRLSDDEYVRLGAALRAAEGTLWPPALAALLFLTLTGWRSGEATGLRWTDVDLVRRTATLPDRKTGRSVRPLSRAACDLLRTQPRAIPIGDRDLAFPPLRTIGLLNLRPIVARIRALGGLPADITPHTLRHSFASLAADVGLAESTIAQLIGHKGYSITSRYLHGADTVLLAAADAVANETARRMGDAIADAVVVSLRATP